MFRLFSNQLTAKSDHLIDWSRGSELLRSSNHHYTAKELRVRVTMVAFGAATGLLGAYFNDEEKTHCSTITMGMLATLAGLLVSHGVVMYPLYKKRKEMRDSCEVLRKEVLEHTGHMADAHQAFLLNEVVRHIMETSLADEKHARASQTWGWRLRMMTAVHASLKADDAVRLPFWQGSVDEMMQKLAEYHAPALQAASSNEVISSPSLR